MGCRISTPISENNTPEIQIIASENVMKKIATSGNIQIIFVFGGPGSRKGRIVNALVQEYGFHSICAEKLILNYLNEKLKLSENCRVLSDHIETQKVEQLLTDNPNILLLEEVLSIVADEVKKAVENQQTRCLIDFVPNLRMLQVHTFIKNCDKEMHQFENEWPCLFALNLDNPDGKQFSTTLTKNLAALQRSGRSDEKDIAKTKRRYEEYLASVRQFIEYFQSSDRLVTVDVSCGISDLIWAKVSEFFNSVGFGPKRAFDSIVIFIFKPEDMLAINVIKHKMEIVNVTSLCKEKKPSIEDLLICLNEQIEKSEVPLRSYIVNLEGVTGFDKLELKENRHILFLNMNSGKFHNYEASQDEFRFSDLPFTAVCSNENDLGICLFPREIPTMTCKLVTMLYSQTKTVFKRNASKNISSV